jgi:hypothetical protein
LELRIGNKIISNPVQITDILNSHFISTVEELVQQKSIGSVYNLKINLCLNSIFIYLGTEENRISLTKSLKGKHMAGDDGIPENLVKQFIHLVKGPLTHIYHLSLNSGVFPDTWKTAKVKPLYKKGDKYDMHNYRSISVIPVFAKLLEKLMYNRMLSFLSENKIFSEAQNGLRKGKSIDTTVQAFTERIQEAVDKRDRTMEYLLI